MRPLSRASRRTEVGTAILATLEHVSDTRLSVLRRLARTVSNVAQRATFWAQCGAYWRSATARRLATRRDARPNWVRTAKFVLWVCTSGSPWRIGWCCQGRVPVGRIATDPTVG